MNRSKTTGADGYLYRNMQKYKEISDARINEIYLSDFQR
ncbi:hypothetical protein CAter10_4114 [Collimonas arenae]|nr:hypothetical protein CAter10_4114 [Collimonas arenae]